jgi:hypothetical protein
METVEALAIARNPAAAKPEESVPPDSQRWDYFQNAVRQYPHDEGLRRDVGCHT